MVASIYFSAASGAGGREGGANNLDGDSRGNSTLDSHTSGGLADAWIQLIIMAIVTVVVIAFILLIMWCRRQMSQDSRPSARVVGENVTGGDGAA